MKIVLMFIVGAFISSQALAYPSPFVDLIHSSQSILVPSEAVAYPLPAVDLVHSSQTVTYLSPVAIDLVHSTQVLTVEVGWRSLSLNNHIIPEKETAANAIAGVKVEVGWRRITTV